MKEKFIEHINPEIKELNMYVSDVYYSEEEKVKTLNIELDSEDVIDVEKITKASEIINPIIDLINPDEENYVLDIHSKEKGSVTNE